MTTTPLLRRRHLPSGGIQNFWTAADGHRLRTLRWPVPHSPVDVLLLGGRGDFAEKFAEVIADLVDAKLAVTTFDWRGQGLSGRLTAHGDRFHIDDFAQYINDARGFIAAEFDGQTRPLVIIAHSMGGHLALRLLHDWPGRIARAVLVSPMCGIQTKPLPFALARRWVAWKMRRGAAQEFAPGQYPYGAWFRTRLRMDRLTSDADRFADEAAVIDANPQLAVGGVTFGWLNAAIQSIDLVAQSGYVEAIQTPVLLAVAGLEKLVRPDLAKAIAARLPHGALLDVPAGRHELLKERDSLRAPLLERLIPILRGESPVAGGVLTD
jgi:lysophospholipase